MATASLVYFEGRWSSDEQALIERAAEATEEMREPEAVQQRGAPWVALAHNTGASRVYLASRRGFSDTFRATSAEDLADQIRQFGSLGPSSDR